MKKDSKVEIPKFEAIIEKKVNVHIKGDNTYREAKTEEEAKQIAAYMIKEANQEWVENYGKEKRQQEQLEYIEHNLKNYIDNLKKQLWHMSRDKECSKELIEEVKKTEKELSGILYGTIMIKWHQGYFSDATSFSIEKVKDYGRDKIRC